MFKPLPPFDRCNNDPCAAGFSHALPSNSPDLPDINPDINEVPEIAVPAPHLASSQPVMQVSDSSSDMIEPEVPIDPLNSAYPIPWNWVMATHAEFGENKNVGSRFYRSPSLISPDGQYAAYSRIQMQTEPELFGSRVTSVMFLENLQTGDLRTITASSPLADNLFDSGNDPSASVPGTISILIPVSWSENGDRILARQFEGLLNASDASDYAVIWDRRNNRTSTLSPQRVQYTNAVLLGWSTVDSEAVLFRAGNLGDESWPIWSVGIDGQTQLANQDSPIVYGQVLNQVWTGPQAR